MLMNMIDKLMYLRRRLWQFRLNHLELVWFVHSFSLTDICSWTWNPNLRYQALPSEIIAWKKLHITRLATKVRKEWWRMICRVPDSLSRVNTTPSPWVVMWSGAHIMSKSSLNFAEATTLRSINKQLKLKRNTFDIVKFLHFLGKWQMLAKFEASFYRPKNWMEF